MTEIIFNEEHYEKVIKARYEAGIDDSNKKQIFYDEHELLGKTIVSKISGKEYVVEKIWKEYFSCGNGWYERMLLNHKDSHRTLIFKNISNENALIIESIEKDFKEFF